MKWLEALSQLSTNIQELSKKLESLHLTTNVPPLEKESIEVIARSAALQSLENIQQELQKSHETVVMLNNYENRISGMETVLEQIRMRKRGGLGRSSRPTKSK